MYDHDNYSLYLLSKINIIHKNKDKLSIYKQNMTTRKCHFCVIIIYINDLNNCLCNYFSQFSQLLHQHRFFYNRTLLNIRNVLICLSYICNQYKTNELSLMFLIYFQRKMLIYDTFFSVSNDYNADQDSYVLYKDDRLMYIKMMILIQHILIQNDQDNVIFTSFEKKI